MQIKKMKFSHHIQNYFPNFKVSLFKTINNKNLSLTYSVPSKAENLNEIIQWPTNIFLILYTLVDYTDKYRLLVAPQKHFKWDRNNLNTLNLLAKEWDTFFGGKPLALGSVLIKHLNVIFKRKNFNQCVYDLINSDSGFCSSLFFVLLSIDRAFEDNNLKKFDYDELTNIEVALLTRMVMKDLYDSSPKNSEIALEPNIADNDTRYGFVSFKSLVPQSGLTINNLCQNLTFIKPSVKPQIVYNNTKNNSKRYNVLLLPWPYEIRDEYFSSSKVKPIETDNYFDFFSYEPMENYSELSKSFMSAIVTCMKRVGQIDLIVLPECSLSQVHYDRLRDLLYEKFKDNSPSLLAGVYGRTPEGVGINKAVLSFIGASGDFDYISQNKHHRWFLDRDQIRTYNLATQLDPNKKWWEDIGVSRRNLVILDTSNGVKLCPLVCEDLARQEPVAQAVRSIGPNFVISLLLDGPQLENRWPGKYSAVLSDDPGCTVFSVTPLGMTLRSTGSGFSPSRVVGLWSEPNKPSERIEIQDEGIGVLLELSLSETQCWSIDGRVENKVIPKKEFHTTIKDEYSDLNSSLIRTIFLKKS
ncbi:hypothetical protein [Pseudoalteromonas phenolica]|uniref:hypothetical protein n=1 Tax=Pseudoalteromonas phenolica TaxID=161398 RepID=UPI00384C87D1